MSLFHEDFQLNECFCYQLSWEDKLNSLKQSLLKFLRLTLTHPSINLASFQKEVSDLPKDFCSLVQITELIQLMSRRDMRYSEMQK